MNRELLLQLRRVLLEAPEDRLHMRTLCGPKAACGTAMCLAGFAAVDPWFRAHTPLSAELAAATHRLAYAGPAAFLLRPAAVGFEVEAAPGGWDRARDLFGLSDDDADALFGWALNYDDAAHAVTRAEVLWNLDELLAGRSPRPYAATAEQTGYPGLFAADRDPADVPCPYDEEDR
jgi:hypothetical protein